MFDYEMKIDFYQIDAEGPSTFLDVLGLVEALEGEERAKYVRGIPMVVNVLTRGRGQTYGNLVKIRETNLPRRAKRSGVLTDFSLEDDEGMGEEAAFLYHHATNILLMQRNRTATTITRLLEYFENMAAESDLEGPIAFTPHPLLQGDAMKRVRGKTHLELQLQTRSCE